MGPQNVNSNNGGAAPGAKRASSKPQGKENGTTTASKRQKTVQQAQIEAESTPSTILATSAARVLTTPRGSMTPPPAPRKKNPLNFSKPNQDMVEILVGTEEQLFRIHKDAICYWSPYFRNVFTSQTIEAESKSMKLADVNENVFGLFNNYLYTQEIEHSDEKHPELMELAHLWTCAAQWKVPSLQNNAMDMLIPMLDVINQVPTESKDCVLMKFVKHAYSVEGDSPLKKLAAVKMTQFVPQDVPLKEWMKGYPEDMLMDLTQALAGHLHALPFEHLRFIDLKRPNYQVKEDE